MKKHSPSAERNKHEILPVLRTYLPAEGLLLEIASGTGQQALHFAAAFPKLEWQPTELDPENLASIRAHAAEASLENLLDPIHLDVRSPTWPIDSADAMLNINMLHIAPWETCEALFAGAGRTLHEGAPLCYYGAFFRDGHETAQSNLDFDASLKERNPSWGIRRLEDVEACAERHGLALETAIDMPKNNYCVIFRRT